MPIAKSKKNTVEEANDALFDRVLEKHRDGYQNNLESFEHYKARKKKEYQQAFTEYAERLQHGYQVIMDGIALELKNKD